MKIPTHSLMAAWCHRMAEPWNRVAFPLVSHREIVSPFSLVVSAFIICVTPWPWATGEDTFIFIACIVRLAVPCVSPLGSVGKCSISRRDSGAADAITGKVEFSMSFHATTRALWVCSSAELIQTLWPFLLSVGICGRASHFGPRWWAHLSAFQRGVVSHVG